MRIKNESEIVKVVHVAENERIVEPEWKKMKEENFVFPAIKHNIKCMLVPQTSAQRRDERTDQMREKKREKKIDHTNNTPRY